MENLSTGRGGLLAGEGRLLVCSAEDGPESAARVLLYRRKKTGRDKCVTPLFIIT